MFNCRLIEKITRGQKKMVNRKDLLFSVCMLTCWVGRIKLFQSTKSRSIKKLQILSHRLCGWCKEYDFGAYRFMYEFWFCYFLAVWPWASCWIFLNLNYLIFWLVIIILLVRVVVIIKWDNAHIVFSHGISHIMINFLHWNLRTLEPGALFESFFFFLKG